MTDILISLDSTALVGAIHHTVPIFIELFSPTKLTLADRTFFFADVLFLMRHDSYL